MDPQIIYAFTGVLAVLLGGLAVVIPVAGLTLRLALKPVLQSWIEIKERQLPDRRGDVLERRMDLLETEIQQMQHSLQAVLEGEDFNRRLHDGDSVRSDAPARRSSVAPE